MLSFDPLSPKFIFDQSAAFRNHFDIADLGEAAFQKPLPNTWLVRVTPIAFEASRRVLSDCLRDCSAMTPILPSEIVQVSIASQSWLMLCISYNVSL